MKFLFFLAALAAVAYAGDVSVFVDDKEITDSRLDALNLLTEFETHRGDGLVIFDEEIEGKNIVEDKIIALLESVREKMQTGDPDNGIPPLDPLRKDILSVKYAIPLLFTTTLSLKDIEFHGLSSFEIEKVRFNILRLSFEMGLNIDLLQYESDFDVSGKITLVVPFRFGGHMRLRLKRFDLDTTAALGTNADGTLNLREFFLGFKVEKATIHFDGVIGNGPLNEIFNWLLSLLANGTIKNIVAGLSQSLNDALFELINTALGNISLGDLLG